MIAIAALSLVAFALEGTPDNVDTGIRGTQCYRAGDDHLAKCATANIPAQDGQLGRDTYAASKGSADGALGLSFRRLCNSGQETGTGTCPAAPAIGDGRDEWGCVEDKLTHMMWEVKTDSGYRARTLRYTNYSREYDPLGQYRSATDATGYVDAVNRAGLCGFDDWELGHSSKIQSILDYGVAAAGAARVDAGFFPTINADWYWNASLNPSAASTAFAVDFADGAVSNAAERGTLRYAQVLRKGKDTHGPDGRYEYSADGSEVHDTTVHATLTWRRCLEGMAWNGSTCTGTATAFTHEQALQHAAQEAVATGLPWRVPSVKEQNFLVRREYTSPAIDHVAFPGTPPAPSWTSTPEVRHPSRAWVVDFGVGLIAQHARSEALYLRLARDPDAR